MTFSLSDAPLKSSLGKFLPIGANYTIIQSFISSHSKHSFGRVHHALAGALSCLLEDYLLLVAQLESRLSQPMHGEVYPGLASLWNWFQPTFVRIKLLADLVQMVSGGPDLRGGKVLSIIHDCWSRSLGYFGFFIFILFQLVVIQRPRLYMAIFLQRLLNLTFK